MILPAASGDGERNMTHDDPTSGSMDPQPTTRPGRNIVDKAGVIIGVLSVVYVLYSLVFSGNGENGAHEATKVILRTVIHAATAYEVSTNSTVDHKATPQLFPMNSGKRSGMAVPDSWNERFVAQMWSHQRARAALERLPATSLVDTEGNGFLEILDAWGTPLIYVHGVSHSDSFTDDDFLPETPIPTFISAGYDRKFGDVRNAVEERAKDNLTSSDLY